MPKRRPSADDLTQGFLDDQHQIIESVADEAGRTRQTFNKRNKFHQHNKTLATAAERMADAARTAERKKLPVGRVLQVYSLYSDVEPLDGDVAAKALERTGSGLVLCTARRTMRKLISEELGEFCVGDRVRFTPTGGTAQLPGGGRAEFQVEGVIEAVLPRQTILTRVDSFVDAKQDPIVANADAFLIVASMHNPFPRFGLIDRMLVAAKAGGLRPAVVVNKSDLADAADDAAGTLAALEHYRTLGVTAFTTSIETGDGLDALRDYLAGQTTVLAGHSGVGKSSLIRAVQPKLDLAVGVVSEAHGGKGRHTTTSAKWFALDHPQGGAVVDTPGVKVFGLWGVTADELIDFFPDVAAKTAPAWRVESYGRIRESLLPGYDRSAQRADDPDA